MRTKMKVREGLNNGNITHYLLVLSITLLNTFILFHSLDQHNNPRKEILGQRLLDISLPPFYRWENQDFKKILFQLSIGTKWLKWEIINIVSWFLLVRALPLNDVWGVILKRFSERTLCCAACIWASSGYSCSLWPNPVLSPYCYLCFKRKMLEAQIMHSL